MAIPNPEFEFVDVHEFAVVRTDASRGIIKRGLRHPNRIRRWELRWQNATLVEKDDLEAEFDTYQGSAGEFAYQPCDEAAPLTVRFVDDSFEWEWRRPGTVAMSAVIEEVLGG